MVRGIAHGGGPPRERDAFALDRARCLSDFATAATYGTALSYATRDAIPIMALLGGHPERSEGSLSS